MFKWFAIAIAILSATSIAVHSQDEILITYLNTIADMNEGYFVTTSDEFENVMYLSGTALSILEENQRVYQARLDTLNSLEVPAQVADIHIEYVNTVERAIEAIETALIDVPLTAAAESAPTYIYQVPDYGYVFDDENAAICALKAVAEKNGITDFPSLLCDRVLNSGEGRTVGSPEQPVNEVYILHEAGCNGMCPGITYDITTIYARAGQPLTIEFENRNPLPFLFNLAIYRGFDLTQRLSGENLIVSTNAGGPRIHSISLTLEPGVYTFADNVHPRFMQGQIIVVD